MTVQQAAAVLRQWWTTGENIKNRPEEQLWRNFCAHSTQQERTEAFFLAGL